MCATLTPQEAAACVDSWGSKGLRSLQAGNGLRYQTYQAVARRDGVYISDTAGEVIWQYFFLADTGCMSYITSRSISTKSWWIPLRKVSWWVDSMTTPK